MNLVCIYLHNYMHLFQPQYVDGLLNPSHRKLSFTTEREREREKESTMENEQLFLFLWFYTVLVKLYSKEFLRGFLPCGFPEENICVLVFLCFCVCCSFSDLLVENCFKISSKQL